MDANYELKQPVNEGIAAVIPILIKAGRDTELKLLLNNKENISELNNSSYELIQSVCAMISMQETPVVIHLAKLTLGHLIDIGKPKELLLEFLSEFEGVVDDIKLYALIDILQSCILKVESRRHYSIGLTLETFYGLVESFELPEIQQQQLEGKERMLVHSLDKIIKIVDICDVMLNFVKPFVDQITPHLSKKMGRKGTMQEIHEIVFFLILLLAKPIVYLDLSDYSSINVDEKSSRNTFISDIRQTSQSLISYIAMLQPNFVKLILQQSQRNATVRKKRKNPSHNYLLEDDEIPDIGLACFSFLTFGQRFSIGACPQVYTHRYCFDVNLNHIFILMSSDETFVQEKGTELMIQLLSFLDDSSFDKYYLENQTLRNIIDTIIDIVTKTQSKSFQQRTLAIISSLINKFEIKQRYKMFMYLWKTCSHIGFLGYVILILKDFIHSCFSEDIAIEKTEFLSLFTCIFMLEVETDIIDHKDIIMSSLNFLRYLLLRDAENATGIWDETSKIEINFLDVLRKSLDLSRAHYKLEAKNLNEGKVNTEESIDFSVGDDIMIQPTNEERMQVLQNALNMFDMIELLLARVLEVISLKFRK